MSDGNRKRDRLSASERAGSELEEMGLRLEEWPDATSGISDVREITIEDLWQKFVFARSGEQPESHAEREALALRLIQQLRSEYNEALLKGRGDEALHALQEATIIWHLLASMIGSFLLWPTERVLSAGSVELNAGEELCLHTHAAEDLAVPAVEAVARAFRVSQAVLLQFAPKVFKIIDPVAVLMPRRVLTHLGQSVYALLEQDDLLAPDRDKMQIRALEHVAFLQGQRFTKGAAQSQVAEALGVKERTLRNWEPTQRRRLSESAELIVLELALEVAMEAGRVTIQGGPVRSTAVAEYLEQVTAEPLEQFGQKYRECFASLPEFPDGIGKKGMALLP